MSDTSLSGHIRTATLDDVPTILKLINGHAKKGLMLMKSPVDIYHNIFNFVVFETDGKVVGCSRLSVLWKDIGEVASLAVSDNYKRRGIGKILVNACLDKARMIGLPQVFTLTYQVDFFKNCGFKKVKKETLPYKVFGDCLKCPKVECCDETAMLYTINTAN